MPDAYPAASILFEPAQSKCTDISQEPFCVEIYRENAGPVFCASLRSGNAHGHLTRGTMEIYRENAGRLCHGQCFVRACAVEMQIHMSQESFCVEIHRENAGRFRYHLD